MKKIILLKTSLKAIARHPARSFLTILGVMVGASAIVVTFSIGRGAEDKIRAQVAEMGEGTILILPGNVITPGGTRSSLAQPARLTIQDLEALHAQIDGIREISRGTLGYLLMERGTRAVKEQVIGADANILKIFCANKIKYGVAFTQEHVTTRANVVIIGSTIAEKLFGAECALDKTIRIGGFPFVVIAAIRPQAHYFGTDDPNARVFVPFTTAKKYFKQLEEVDDDLGYIGFSLYHGVPAARVVRTAKRVLRFRHTIAPADEDDFIVLNQESIAQTASAAGTIVKLFGLIAASISLIVGGVGVMNIMLVCVQERKQEIGLRIAVGATRALVQLQFILESAILCGIGGILGTALGLLGQWAIVTFTILPSTTEITPLVMSLLATIAIGIFFGYYPARRASLLDPISALMGR